MADAAGTAPVDEFAAALAAYAAEADATLTADASRAATRALVDSVAVATGAFRHRAAQAARRYADRVSTGSGPSTIWGTTRRASAEAATLVNGVLLRCYDYNDLHVGKRSAAHPSDMIAGLVAVAEWTNASGRQLLSAIALGYEITMDLLDTLAVAPGGWDYANLTGLAATCAVARLMGLNQEQVREALAIAVIPHFASDEIESGDLNRHGDLTMWKRFNGGDAIRQAVYACTLASAGIEGVVRPFTGKLGLLAKLQSSEDPTPYFRAKRAERRPLSRVTRATMKRWPVGSRAQSAVQAALAARAKIADATRITAVRVLADPSAYEHLVRSRQDPWHPISRETADHSLPYIVAAAVLDGHVRTDSFAPSRVLNPARQAFLQKVKVSSVAADRTRTDVAAGYAGAYSARVEIDVETGDTVTAEAAVPPGHPDNPFSEADLDAKLRDCAGSDLDVSRLSRAMWAVDGLTSVRDLTVLLQVTAANIDSDTTE